MDRTRPVHRLQLAALVVTGAAWFALGVIPGLFVDWWLAHDTVPFRTGWAQARLAASLLFWPQFYLWFYRSRRERE